ncbi:uncharacterized protein LOC101456566 isoform X1 [Ceratitis capitata]|uniref:uncharacterized protein LOC101456566 isoform X1 n=2 Tax=Ceratitis capitata TaxID=7213 RepID=UPI0003297DB9|nr:uncharacterized protein LOC101456566 isoform X1 [Ceratitis capitata]XP_020714319.1 uncharacterized protein LOC101456566 isoform X1 [Ceratitis capitata]
MSPLARTWITTSSSCRPWSILQRTNIFSTQTKRFCQQKLAVSVLNMLQSFTYNRSWTLSSPNTRLLSTVSCFLSPTVTTALSSLRLLTAKPLLLCNRNFFLIKNKKICTVDSSYLVHNQKRYCCHNVLSSHSHLQPNHLLSDCQRIQTRTQTRYISSASKLFQKSFTRGVVMDAPEGVFRGTIDRFNGVLIESASEHDETTDFAKKLQKSLDYWISIKRRAIWFTVQKEHAAWVPELAKADFEFHHVCTSSSSVVMYRWLPTEEYANIPTFCHTMLGVGGLVVNDNDEVLVVSDRYALIANSWKLPGGYVEPGEELVNAAIREVKEETGIDCVFRTVLSIRHSHGGSFGCSDMYVVVALKPLNLEVHKCEREIAKAKWMPVAEYLQHPDVHETNRHFMRTYLDYNKRGICFTYERAQHSVLKREYALYFMKPIEGHNES